MAEQAGLLIMLAVLGGSNLVIAVLAIPLMQGKVAPNAWYGFRTRATLSDPDIWYPVNAVGGKWLLITSLVNLAACILFFFIPGITIDGYAFACLAVVVVGMIFTMQRSFGLIKKIKKDKEAI